MNAQQIAQATGLAEKRGGEWYGLCPVHPDKKPSLAITKRDGKLLFKCWRGCDQSAVFDAVKERGWLGNGIAPRDGSSTGASQTQALRKRAPIVDTYDYTDQTGTLLFQVCRREDKSFSQRRPDGNGGWDWSVPADIRTLYRLPEVIAAVEKGRRIFLTEGEKDVDRLTAEGLVATCNPGGAGKWESQYTETLRGGHVIILPDNDPPGKEHAEKVAGYLNDASASLKVIHLPDLTPKGDISDWLDSDGTISDLKLLIQSADEWVSTNIDATHVVSLTPGYSEDALASQFTELHGSTLRYTAVWGKWHQWTGERWAEDETLHVFDMARKICKQAVSDPELKPNQVNRICSAKVVAAVVALSRADRKHAARGEQWDADPFLLNMPGETINLQTGEVWPNRLDDYCSKMTAVKPGGGCPLWHEFLRVVADGDDDLIGYLRRLSGYALSGSVREHSFHFFWGTGRNGKSTFTGTLMGIMNDYARPVPVEVFLESKHSMHSTNIAQLHGIRLAVSPETGQGVPWNESRLSMLTGGEKITAHYMRQDNFDFQPTHTLICSGNHRPRIRGINEAMKSRIHLIPFTVTIPPDKRDKDLPEKLKEEWPGILEWMIQGTADWFAEGLNPPAVVVDATEEYFSNEDVVGKWIEDCCTVAEFAQGTSGSLYGNFKGWCETNREDCPSQRAFGDALEQRGHPRHRTGSGRFHKGIGINQ